jgi:hypothetical protein
LRAKYWAIIGVAASLIACGLAAHRAAIRAKRCAATFPLSRRRHHWLFAGAKQEMDIVRRKQRQFTEREALFYHKTIRPGKIEIIAIEADGDASATFRLAYSPGVAVPVQAIADDPATPTTIPPRATSSR